MGGESQERDISRVTGTEVAKALVEAGHDVVLVDTEHGRMELQGDAAPRIGTAPPDAGDAAPVPHGSGSVQELTGAVRGVDCVFIALHGGWGEDGTVQAVFEMAGIPYTGSGVLGSALAMDKDRSKRVFRASGVPTADWVTVDVTSGIPDAAALTASARGLGRPLVVKPNTEGSTVGLTILQEDEDLLAAVERAARFGPRVMLERYVPGRELTVGVLGTEALPVVEIVPDGGLYDYEAKYTKGRSRYDVPADLPAELAERIQSSAVTAFQALGCEGFGRVDYRLPDDGDFQCLEVNTIPGMTPLSLVPMAAQAAGVSFPDLVDRLVEHAVARGTRRDPGRAEARP
ncbi:MAG: D-alanine--D-alanine ligase [Gemmatimonadetes bacterium]|nr:D-alanine--D-alanine ligase [Gemmatimonadota bacterium]